VKNKKPLKPLFINYAVVVLKGVVEKNDPGAYFASFGGLLVYTEEAKEAGWLDSENGITDAGRVEYERRGLDKLPRVGRAYLWPDPNDILRG